MAKKASDLSSSEKRQALEAIRQQIGDSQFEEFVSKHGENALIDLLLQAAEGKSSSEKDDGWDKAQMGCFGFLWVILSITVGVYTSGTVGVLFFFSPSLYFLFFGAPGILGETLANRLPWGCGLAVAVVIMIIIASVFQSVPEKLIQTVFVVAMMGGFATGIVVWLAGITVRMMRRISGKG